jgi:hypothetical protein
MSGYGKSCPWWTKFHGSFAAVADTVEKHGVSFQFLVLARGSPHFEVALHFAAGRLASKLSCDKNILERAITEAVDEAVDSSFGHR